MTWTILLGNEPAHYTWAGDANVTDPPVKKLSPVTLQRGPQSSSCSSVLRSSDDLFSVSSEIQADSKGSPDIPGKPSMREKRGGHKGKGRRKEGGRREEGRQREQRFCKEMKTFKKFSRISTEGMLSRNFIIWNWHEITLEAKRWSQEPFKEREKERKM